MKIKKGDLVEVIAGKDKGKRGKVLRVYPDTNRLLVQSVNVSKRHMRQKSQDTQGGIVDLEAPLSISNVLIVCGKCSRSVRTGFKILEDGTKMRICTKCKEAV
ncbi:MAG: 50S ribosomal protein L24 [Candidatus Omnitrophica bacterium]|nr:50S ribosomal protein L24 [Candidatus Omnitrophota bacterium]